MKIMKITVILKSWMMIAFVAIMGGCATDEETVIVPKTLDQYKVELQVFVDSQIGIVDNCVVGYNKGDFRSSTNYEPYTTAYKTVLTAAQTTLQKADLTIADVVKARVSLATDGKNFQTNLYISDRRPLNDLIVECDTLNLRTLDGTAVGQVSPDNRIPFTTALTAAKVVRNATTTVERQVTEEVAKLNTAKTAFQQAIIK